MGKRKYAEIPTLPMFDEPPRQAKPKRDTAPRSVAWAKCPKCLTTKPVGLQRVGDHLVWREHYVRTWGGERRPCGASGVTVCSLPPGAGETKGATSCRHPA